LGQEALANNTNSCIDVVAIGDRAVRNTAISTVFGGNQVGIGKYASRYSAGENSVSIGNEAGVTNAGTNCINIGMFSGFDNSVGNYTNTTILNSSGAVLNPIANDSSYLSSLRTFNIYASSAALSHNNTTREVLRTPLIKMIVYGSTTQSGLAAASALICDQILLSVGVVYNPATGIWTCPSTGYYRIKCSFTGFAPAIGGYNLYWGIQVGLGFGIVYNNIINLNSLYSISASNEFVLLLTAGSNYAFVMDGGGFFSIDLTSTFSQWEIEFICSS
jgi:hypothetical protein